MLRRQYVAQNKHTKVMNSNQNKSTTAFKLGQPVHTLSSNFFLVGVVGLLFTAFKCVGGDDMAGYLKWDCGGGCKGCLCCIWDCEVPSSFESDSD